MSLPMPAASRISKTGAAVAEEAAHVPDRPQRHAAHEPNGITAGEWLCTTAMHVGPRAVDLAVDEALEIDRRASAVDRVAVEIEFDDVAARHQRGAMLRASR